MSYLPTDMSTVRKLDTVLYSNPSCFLTILFWKYTRIILSLKSGAKQHNAQPQNANILFCIWLSPLLSIKTAICCFSYKKIYIHTSFSHLYTSICSSRCQNNDTNLTTRQNEKERKNLRQIGYNNPKRRTVQGGLPSSAASTRQMLSKSQWFILLNKIRGVEARRGCYGAPQVPEVGYLQKGYQPFRLSCWKQQETDLSPQYMAMPFSHELESRTRHIGLTCLGVGSEEPIEFSILCFWKCSWKKTIKVRIFSRAENR